MKTEKQYYVRESFIKQVHSAACKEWKDKIEAEFPEVFPEVFPVSKIDRMIREVGTSLYSNYKVISIKVVVDKHGSPMEFVCVPMPRANTEWTKDAFRYVERFLDACDRAEEKIECYPYHPYKDEGEIMIRAAVEKYTEQKGPASHCRENTASFMFIYFSSSRK